MKVLVVGGGGREHALAWKIAQSERVERVYCAPGNAGIAEQAECVDISAEDLDGLLKFAKDEAIGLTVVGPEAPLVAGIVDAFAEEGLKVFGPSGKAAELEGSKVFAKKLMKRNGIPTADFKVFDNREAAAARVELAAMPIVVKADGLAAGKGVIVCKTKEEALDAVDLIMCERKFGSAGDQVIIEECLIGEEASILVFTDGKTLAVMPTSQDHKPIYDGDQGPNTGGMGAYSPAPVITDKLSRQIERDILIPTVDAMKKERRPYRGVLYAGLMITSDGPKVLEYNVRFGDPETQPILMRLKSDLVPVLEAVADRRLDQAELEWRDEPAVCVVMASGGYPGSYEKGKPVSGLDHANAMPDVHVFHAGTAKAGPDVVTSGGRVLGVTAFGSDVQQAINKAYAATAVISFEGAQYRRDIGAKALGR